MQELTYQSVEVRPVLIPLRRPVVSKVGRFDRWPVILIDLHTHQGVVGKSYLEPYLERSARYIVPAIRDLVEARNGSPIRPLEDFQGARKALNLVGYEGMVYKIDFTRATFHETRKVSLADPAVDPKRP